MPFSKEAPIEGRPAVVVRDALAEDPSCGRKALAAAAKRKIKSQEDADRLLQVQVQGEMLCTTTSDIAPLKAKTVQALSSNTMKLPLMLHMTPFCNLQLWKKEDNAACPCVLRDRAYCMYSTTARWLETFGGTTMQFSKRL